MVSNQCIPAGKYSVSGLLTWPRFQRVGPVPFSDQIASGLAAHAVEFLLLRLIRIPRG